MPKFSAFNPYGALRFSSRPSHGEKIFREMVRAVGGEQNYSTDFDGMAMARLYAFAMAFGRCKYALERTGSQFRPDRVLELLPALEKEYGIAPERNATLAQRRADLAAAAQIARGARYTNVVEVLTALLGDDFVSYLPTDVADAVVTTTMPQSRGVYDKPGTLRSVFRLTSHVSRINAAITVQAEFVTGAKAAPAPGARFVLDTGDPGRVEAVTVTAATLTGTTLTLTATFTKPHSSGTVLATGRHPNLVGSKRHNLFVLTADGAPNNRARRRLHRAARRLLRETSTWAITDGTGPFKVGQGKLGLTTIGAVT